MENIKRFNPEDVTVMINSPSFGSFAVTCMGSDDVTCSKDNDSASASVGAQGDVVVNLSCDHLGTVSFPVQAQSPQLKTLKQMAKVVDQFAIWVINKSTGEKTGGSKAYFKKPADNGVGQNLNDRTFEAQVLDYTDE